MQSDETGDEAPEQIPFADAPCDARECGDPWVRRIEFQRFTEFGVSSMQTRFVCARHGMQDTDPLPEHH